jgi:hypothetical protein
MMYGEEYSKEAEELLSNTFATHKCINSVRRPKKQGRFILIFEDD